VESLPDLEPAAGQVLIATRAAAVNFPDLLVMSGKYQNLPSFPFSPGKDAAGVVAAVGAGVKRLVPGQRVVAQLEHGGYASQVIAPEQWVHPIPDSITFVDAAAMGLVYQTAWFALVDRAGFKSGDSVLVTGAAGGVGLAAVQLVKTLGGRVLAGIGTAEKAKLVRDNGADAVIDLAQPDPRNSIRQQIYAANGGNGVDIALDIVGGDVFDGALRSLAWCGRIVVIGFAAARIPEIKANYLLVKNISALGLQWSDYRERTPDRVAEVQAKLMDLYEKGLIRPHVMQTFPLKAFAEALAIVEAGKAAGKVVLTMGTESVDR
jgi:NADPH2:quinone reductase